MELHSLSDVEQQVACHDLLAEIGLLSTDISGVGTKGRHELCCHIDLQAFSENINGTVGQVAEPWLT